MDKNTLKLILLKFCKQLVSSSLFNTYGFNEPIMQCGEYFKISDVAK